MTAAMKVSLQCYAPIVPTIHLWQRQLCSLLPPTQQSLFFFFFLPLTDRSVRLRLPAMAKVISPAELATHNTEQVRVMIP